MELKVNTNKFNCFSCALRDGKYCGYKEDDLILERVEDNILSFEPQENCVAYFSRRNL